MLFRVKVFVHFFTQEEIRANPKQQFIYPAWLTVTGLAFFNLTFEPESDLELSPAEALEEPQCLSPNFIISISAAGLVDGRV